MANITKYDPGSRETQIEVSEAVWGAVEAKSFYTMRFRGRAVSAISAIGARELYSQCVRRFSLPIFELVETNDKVVEGIWICDARWRATDPITGATWLFSTRGSEPYNPAEDTMQVANRKAYGKAVRNAALECVPLSIREAFLEYLSRGTGQRVYAHEEDAASDTQPKPHPTKDNYTQVYEHARSLGYDPRNHVPVILKMDLSRFFQQGGTADSAITLINEYHKQHSPA